MKLAIVLTLAAASLCAEDRMEQYRKTLTAVVTKADAALEKANNERDTKVKRALHDYLEILQKAKVYWVKKGNLDRALEVRTEIRRVEGILNPAPKPPPVKVGTARATGRSYRRRPSNSYKGVVFDKKYRYVDDMLKAEKHLFEGWNWKQISAFRQAFAVWRTSIK